MARALAYLAAAVGPGKQGARRRRGCVVLVFLLLHARGVCALARSALGVGVGPKALPPAAGAALGGGRAHHGRLLVAAGREQRAANGLVAGLLVVGVQLRHDGPESDAHLQVVADVLFHAGGNALDLALERVVLDADVSGALGVDCGGREGTWGRWAVCCV